MNSKSDRGDKMSPCLKPQDTSKGSLYPAPTFTSQRKSVYMLPRKARTNNTIIICWPLHLLPSETLLLLRHQLFSSIKCTNLLWTTLHIALYTTDVKNIQWKASALHTPVLLFFGIGTTYYTFSSLWGNHPIPQTPIEEAASEVRTPEHCRRPSWLFNPSLPGLISSLY